MWQHRRRVRRLPRDLVADRRYGTLGIYPRLPQLDVRAGNPHRAGKKRNAGRVGGIREFQYKGKCDTYTCPAGGHADPPVRCSLTRKERRLRRSFERGCLEEAQRWLKTEEGKRGFRQRKVHVQTVFTLAEDSHPLRWNHWRAKRKLQIQVWLTAVAMNTKKIPGTTAAVSGASIGRTRAFSRRLIWG